MAYSPFCVPRLETGLWFTGSEEPALAVLIHPDIWRVKWGIVKVFVPLTICNVPGLVAMASSFSPFLEIDLLLWNYYQSHIIMLIAHIVKAIHADSVVVFVQADTVIIRQGLPAIRALHVFHLPSCYLWLMVTAYPAPTPMPIALKTL